MAKWIYTLESGPALREAIENEEVEQVAKCLLKCLEELVNKLSTEDKDWVGWDIEDLAENINAFLGDGDLDEDELDDYLDDFYNICDDVRVWIGI